MSATFSESCNILFFGFESETSSFSYTYRAAIDTILSLSILKFLIQSINGFNTGGTVMFLITALICVVYIAVDKWG